MKRKELAKSILTVYALITHILECFTLPLLTLIATSLTHPFTIYQI